MTRRSASNADVDRAVSASLLTLKELKVCCDPALLDFEDTTTLEPLPGLIGQERALGAIRIAASTPHADFNLFVPGRVGAGRHVMLRANLIEAVVRGRFRIYAISHVDEAIKLLTGLPAGTRSCDGAFEDGPVNANVEMRLRDFANHLQGFLKPTDRALEIDSDE